MQLVSADELELPQLADLFNDSFSDYVVPLQLSESAFADHLGSNGIDLKCSPVVMQDKPVAFALIARREAAGWVGGMGTVPSHRRRGLGKRALVAGLEAVSQQGCRAVWLEVTDANRPAIRLYENLGFEVVRDLIVWSLDAKTDGVRVSRPVEAEQAQAWIVANRESREPWQRTDQSLARIGARGPRLCGLLVEHGSDVTGAVVFRPDPETVTVLQIAAVDEASAASALLASAGTERGLRLSNAPVGESPSRALERLGARPVARQHEMVLRM